MRASTTVALAALLAAAGIVVSGSTSWVSAWLGAVRAEIPSWTRVALAPATSPLAHWQLDVEPDVLRAAQLLSSGGSPQSGRDGLWFPVQVAHEGKRYRAEGQLLDGSDTGLRVRFDGKHRPDGMRSIEFVDAAEPGRVREWFEREAARRAGLVAPPSGFARLSVNGAESELVYWSEGTSDAMLQRLGFAAGEIFVPVARAPRGSAPQRDRSGFEPSVGVRGKRAQAAALERLVALVERADAITFEREIGGLVDVERVLAWDVLANGFGATRPDPAWYFDPITGLLSPVVVSFRDAQPGTEPLAEAVVARIAEQPRHRARRAELLARLGRTEPTSILAEADRGLGELVAALGADADWWRRPTRMNELATMRRSLRVAIAAGAARAHEAFDAEHAEQAGRAVATTDREAVRGFVRESGLPFRLDGERLVLPSGTHAVTRTLVVPTSHRLVIEPGARLLMGPDASLIAFRGIEAVGTRERPIAIVAADPEHAWGAIGVARAPETSEFAYVTVSGGSNAHHAGIAFTGQLSFNASDAVVRDCDIVRGHGDDALSVKRALFQVARTRFIDNASDGFDAEWASGAVEHSLFANNGDDGLDLAASEVRVHRAWFRRMGDKAVSAGERSTVTLEASQLIDSQIAIASKEDSRVEVRGSEFRRNEIGISLYRDNAIFGSGYGVVTGGLFTENLRDFAVETGSGLTLNGVERRTVETQGVVAGLRPAPGASISRLQ